MTTTQSRPAGRAAKSRTSGSSATGTKAESAQKRSTALVEDDGSSRPIIGKLESPLTTYYLLLGTTVTLVIYGLVMVFSASSVPALLSNKAAYADFIRQAVFAALGAVACVLAARMSVTWWRRLAVPAVIIAMGLQALVFVPGLGVEVNGNRNWLDFGAGIRMQPAEFGKFALVLFGALVFANKGRLVVYLRHVLLPYIIPVATIILALTLAGKDLGTAMVMVGIVAAILTVAGMPVRFFALAGALAGAGVAYLVIKSDNRMERINNFFNASCQSINNPDGACGQSVHGLYALADGGWWGVGLGGSKEKWNYLAESHNDFIFAIIGEELGLPGTLLVLILFGVLAWACYRLVTRTRVVFVRIAATGVMAWFLLQALVNIGAVIGLIPVIGVPLPFLSAGGSSLVTTLLAVGMLMSFARNEPGARALLAGRPSMVQRSLAVLPGRSVRSTLRRKR